MMKTAVGINGSKRTLCCKIGEILRKPLLNNNGFFSIKKPVNLLDFEFLTISLTFLFERGIVFEQKYRAKKSSSFITFIHLQPYKLSLKIL